MRIWQHHWLIGMKLEDLWVSLCPIERFDLYADTRSFTFTRSYCLINPTSQHTSLHSFFFTFRPGCIPMPSCHIYHVVERHEGKLPASGNFSKACKLGDIFMTQENTLQYGLRSVRYAGAKSWNNIPFNIKQAPSAMSFCCQLKFHLFSTKYRP